jgi:hypothetical protein
MCFISNRLSTFLFRRSLNGASFVIAMSHAKLAVHFFATKKEGYFDAYPK